MIHEKYNAHRKTAYLFPGIGITNDKEKAREWSEKYTGYKMEKVQTINNPRDIE